MTDSVTVPTGLLSDNERAFLLGEKEVEEPQQYEYNVRRRARRRIDQLADDLALLEATENEDIVAEFYHEVDRIERLRDDIQALADRIDRLDGDDPEG